MVVGSGIEDEDLQPIVVGGEIENGRIDAEVDKRIAQRRSKGGLACRNTG